MALQSQAPRTQGWRSGSSSNPLRGASPALKAAIGLGAVASLVVAVIVWIQLRGPLPVQAAAEDRLSGNIGHLTYPASETKPLPLGPNPNVNAPRDPLASPVVSPTPAALGAGKSPDASVPAPATPSAPATPTSPTGAPATTPSPAPAKPATGNLAFAVEKSQQLIAGGNLLEARSTLNAALWDTSATKQDRAAVREQMAALNEKMFFSNMIVSGDSITSSYTVQSGDVLARLPYKNAWPVDYRFIQRINGIANPNSLRVGQRIKIVNQPIHAIVHKKDYRMDLYAGPPIGSVAGKVGPDGQEEGWTYLRSLPVGLGESNGTPEGLFVVRPKSKLINPRWVNPRTGELFEADNPNNPIGEHWIGLDGADDNTRRFTGYGIHGTIDPSSVGTQKSMGCVRLNAEEVRLVWELLVDRVSAVKILD